MPIYSASPFQIERALLHVHEQSKKALQLLIVILPEASGSYGELHDLDSDRELPFSLLELKCYFPF